MVAKHTVSANNSGFENGLTGWTGQGQAVTDSSKAHSGSKYLELSTTGSQVVYVFSGTKVIAEYVNGSLNKEYIYSGSVLVATHDAGTLKYHHHDHLSMRVTTNTSGSIVAQSGHFPYGENWYESG